MTIKLRRSQIKEIYKNGVLIGYIEDKGNGEFRALLLNHPAYTIEIEEDGS